MIQHAKEEDDAIRSTLRKQQRERRAQQMAEEREGRAHVEEGVEGRPHEEGGDRRPSMEGGEGRPRLSTDGQRQEAMPHRGASGLSGSMPLGWRCYLHHDGRRELTQPDA